MSHILNDDGDSLDLRVVGLEEPLASASVCDGDTWTVDPTGIAEHLPTFELSNRADAVSVLKAIGYAFEAGGGGWQ